MILLDLLTLLSSKSNLEGSRIVELDGENIDIRAMRLDMSKEAIDEEEKAGHCDEVHSPYHMV